MHRFPALAAILLTAAPLTTFADVAVWKGTGIQTANVSEVPTKAKVNVYFIVDLSTFVGRFVVALPGTKRVYDEGERSFGINLHETTPKETFYLTDAVEVQPQQGPIEFTHQIAHLSGKTTKVFLRPGNNSESELPKTLKLLLSETAGGILVTRGVVVQGMASLDLVRTQAANAVNKTVLQVRRISGASSSPPKATARSARPEPKRLIRSCKFYSSLRAIS